MPKLPITDIVSIYQQQRTGNQEGYQNSPTYINVNACISPTGTDVQPTNDGVGAFHLFEIYFYDLTLRLHNADKIVTPTGQTYAVDGVPFIINNQYLQYIRCMAKQVV